MMMKLLFNGSLTQSARNYLLPKYSPIVCACCISKRISYCIGIVFPAHRAHACTFQERNRWRYFVSVKLPFDGNVHLLNVRSDKTPQREEISLFLHSTAFEPFSHACHHGKWKFFFFWSLAIHEQQMKNQSMTSNVGKQTEKRKRMN
jgi:hypothetical protein